MIAKPRENLFEESLISALSAAGQSAAYELFTRESLPALTKMWLQDGLPERIRQNHQPPAQEGNAIVRAALVAKLTYILPDNPLLTPQQRDYLAQLALIAAGFSPRNTPFEQALGKIAERHPVLHQWLRQIRAC